MLGDASVQKKTPENIVEEAPVRPLSPLNFISDHFSHARPIQVHSSIMDDFELPPAELSAPMFSTRHQRPQLKSPPKQERASKRSSDTERAGSPTRRKLASMGSLVIVHPSGLSTHQLPGQVRELLDGHERGHRYVTIGIDAKALHRDQIPALNVLRHELLVLEQVMQQLERDYGLVSEAFEHQADRLNVPHGETPRRDSFTSSCMSESDAVPSSWGTADSHLLGQPGLRSQQTAQDGPFRRILLRSMRQNMADLNEAGALLAQGNALASPILESRKELSCEGSEDEHDVATPLIIFNKQKLSEM